MFIYYVGTYASIANAVLLVFGARQLRRVRALNRQLTADAARLDADIQQMRALRTALWHLLLGCWHMRQWPLIHILADKLVQEAINDADAEVERTAER